MNMEEKINVAVILKDKPQGTKLYADAFGELSIEEICTEDELGIILLSSVGDRLLFYNDGKYNMQGEPILVPSKEMRDWNKFVWKKGDVLVTENGAAHIIFEKFTDDTYTIFAGKYYYCKNGAKGYTYLRKCDNAITDEFTLETEDAAKTYISFIEKRLGRKLNRETLEIEKAQPEFKDGDIVVYGKSVAICRKICKHTLFPYVSIDETSRLLFNDNPNVSPDECRFAKEEEKQQLFEALAKEGKAWDAKKKMIVYLKPKYEFKPMDLCLMKYIGQYNNRGWELCQYAYTEHRVSSSGEHRDFYHAVGGEIYAECIPYNEDTKHLLGTKDKWKGGEG